MDTPSWHLLLPLSPPALVLYVGNRGPVAGQQLALSFGPVIVLESTLERARDTLRACRALPTHDIMVVHASALDLPLRSGSVDLAVLETECTDTTGALLEPRFLAAIRTALKPSGHVYIGIDPARSGGGRMGRRSTAFRNLRRSRQVLAATGFRRVRVWGAYPDSRDPKFLVESTPPALNYFLRAFGRGFRTATARLFNRAGLHRYGAPAYSVLATLDAPPLP